MEHLSHDIYYLKLISGEEIVTTIVDSSESTYTIKNSLQIQYQHSPNGVSVHTIEYPVISDPSEPVILAKSSIAVSAKPNIDFMNSYNERFGSGIQIASTTQTRTILNS